MSTLLRIIQVVVPLVMGLLLALVGVGMGVAYANSSGVPAWYRTGSKILLFPGVKIGIADLGLIIFVSAFCWSLVTFMIPRVIVVACRSRPGSPASAP